MALPIAQSCRCGEFFSAAASHRRGALQRSAGTPVHRCQPERCGRSRYDRIRIVIITAGWRTTRWKFWSGPGFHRSAAYWHGREVQLDTSSELGHSIDRRRPGPYRLRVTVCRARPAHAIRYDNGVPLRQSPMPCSISRSVIEIRKSLSYLDLVCSTTRGGTLE